MIGSLQIQRTLAAGTALVLLAACNSEPRGEGGAEDGVRLDSAPANEVELANSTLPAPADPRAGGAALPPPDRLRFVGRWAAEAALCSNRAWQLTPESLHTPAGSVCGFSKVTEVAGGYDIAATCTAEGPPVDEMLRIRFAESARAMMFESDAIADAGLIYCGPIEEL